MGVACGMTRTALHVANPTFLFVCLGCRMRTKSIPPARRVLGILGVLRSVLRIILRWLWVSVCRPVQHPVTSLRPIGSWKALETGVELVSRFQVFSTRFQSRCRLLLVFLLVQKAANNKQPTRCGVARRNGQVCLDPLHNTSCNLGHLPNHHKPIVASYQNPSGGK